jgi:endonuclease/exonuclease/phosphatase family metal-dependent hydrolase
VPLLVRTWNLFHGNTVPVARHAHLEEMVRLVCVDEPDIVCLQEVPIRALRHLAAWSGMHAIGAVAARPRLASAELGHRITRLHHGLFRSAFTGQANAILLARHLHVDDTRAWTISRRGEGERRVCQIVHAPEVGTIVNFHLTNELAEQQFQRTAAHINDVAAAGEPVIICGDTNVRPGEGETYDALRSWGFSEPAPSIDQILVRGLPSTPPVVWPEERRRVDGRLLSDHAPVELSVG